MPLYKTITLSQHTTMYLWKVEETLEKLSQNITLTTHCQNRLTAMKSELHQRGFMSIRHLLAEAGYVDQDLYYDDFGKPHLTDERFISITHSYHFTGIIVSDQEVGIDIEMQRDKILRIANKFTDLESYYTLANAEAIVRKLTIVWGAKESIYKLYGQKGLSFLQHIDVKEFNFDDGQTMADVFYKNNESSYDIGFFEFEGFTCVYALPIVN